MRMTKSLATLGVDSSGSAGEIAPKGINDHEQSLATWSADMSEMAFVHLDYGLGAYRCYPPVDHDIVVIDNFWPTPGTLRELALSAPWERKLSPSGFAFSEWQSPWAHRLRFAELVARACGKALLNTRCESRFVFETADDERRTRERVWIHYDRWRLVAVLYLVPNDIASGGTAFFRHSATGVCSVREADARNIRTAIMADSTRMDCWDRQVTVPIAFNRLVAFKPHMFHQAVNYFGDCPENGRLYCIVAFD